MNDRFSSIGHNKPPTFAELLRSDLVADIIENETTPLKERAKELVNSCRRFIATHAVIETYEQDEIATSILAQCKRFTTAKSGQVDLRRIAVKAPILAAAQAIDHAFQPIAVDVSVAAESLTALSIPYKLAEEARIRNEAIARAKAERDAAEAAEAMARAGSTVVTLNDAAKAHAAADKADVVAHAKPADLTRTRGQDFGMSSLRYKRVVTIENPAAVDRKYCIPDFAALTRAAGKAGTPIPMLAGCKIEDVADLTVRR